jgi:toxin ParE1/3/4
MSNRLRILPAADADVDEAALFIARDSIEAALRFYDAVDTTLRELRAHPKRWPVYSMEHPRLADLRKRAVKGFPNYLVFYRYEDGIVEVIRVLHGARNIPRELAAPLKQRWMKAVRDGGEKIGGAYSNHPFWQRGTGKKWRCILIPSLAHSPQVSIQQLPARIYKALDLLEWELASIHCPQREKWRPRARIPAAVDRSDVNHNTLTGQIAAS